MIIDTNLIGMKELTPFMSQNVKYSRVSPMIEAAQMFDVRPLLGDNLYYDMVDTLMQYNARPDPNTPLTDKEALYLQLMDGFTYGKPTQVFRGLAIVITYFSVARIVLDNDLKINEGGNNFKANQYSERPGAAAIKLASNKKESLAIAYFQDVKKYLNLFYASYPLWQMNDGCCKTAATTKKTSTIRITAVNSPYVPKTERLHGHGCSTGTQVDITPKAKKLVKWGYFEEEPLQDTVINWQFQKEFDANDQIIELDYTAAAAGMYIGKMEEITEPIKRVYYNTAVNRGVIEDIVFNDYTTFSNYPGQSILLSRKPFEMELNHTIIKFSVNGNI